MEDKRNQPDRRESTDIDDTAARSLTEADRKMLNMDSWEPSLLRKLLSAQDRLKKTRN